MRLRLNFRNLCDHELKCSFQDTLNLPCACVLEAEATSQFILYCSLPCKNKRRIFLANNREIERRTLKRI